MISGWGTVAGLITAFATLLTAIGGFFVAIRVLIPVKKQTEQIHTIVNQEKTDRMRFQTALIQTLEEHGIEVPVDQSTFDHQDKTEGTKS